LGWKEDDRMAAETDEDVIAALGTPLGYGAIGIVRLSGTGAIELADRIFKARKKETMLGNAPDRVMLTGHICSINGEIIDEVLAVAMKGPRSYTRQDVVEIHSHGGILAASRILERVLQEGARLADAGEFTKRAWINGRIDLAQAEAVIDLIRARSVTGMSQAVKQLDGALSELVKDLRQKLKRLMAGVEASIDFPDEVSVQEEETLKGDLQLLKKKIEDLLETAKAGRIFREGLAVVLLGKPNSGKSTLLNRILGAERALVTNVPGTTRDLIEEMVSIRGIPIQMIDTAGIREKAGIVEALGIEKAKEALDRADLVMAVFDATVAFETADRMVLNLLENRRGLILLNKIDAEGQMLDRKRLEKEAAGLKVLEISAQKGLGIKELEQALVALVGAEHLAAAPAIISKLRHQKLLEEAREAIGSALKTITTGGTLDCAAIDLWEAWTALGGLLGEEVSGEIVEEIFKEFCVGK
jgi:tRNA modification GTPase